MNRQQRKRRTLRERFTARQGDRRAGSDQEDAAMRNVRQGHGRDRSTEDRARPRQGPQHGAARGTRDGA